MHDIHYDHFRDYTLELKFTKVTAHKGETIFLESAGGTYNECFIEAVSLGLLAYINVQLTFGADTSFIPGKNLIKYIKECNENLYQLKNLLRGT